MNVMDLSIVPYLSSDLKILWMKLSQMAAGLCQPRTLNPSKFKVLYLQYTVKMEEVRDWDTRDWTLLLLMTTSYVLLPVLSYYCIFAAPSLMKNTFYHDAV